jgi:glycosyltransferase involved in cell wall biosynthesis
MRVLVVTTSYPSRRAPHNGVFIREHCLALKRRGAEVTVLVPRVFREDPVDEDDGGIAVHRFPFWSGQRLLTEYASIPAVRMLTYLVSGVFAGARLARRTRSDVVHGHWAIPTGFIALMAARLSALRPVVVTAHRKDIEVARSGSRIARALAAYTLTRADRVVAVSGVLRDELVDGFGVECSRIEVVPMGVDTGLFAPSDREAARARLDIAPGMRLALFVGGLIPVKGVGDLIEAMGSVLPGDPDVLLTLAGAGPLEADLRAQAETLGQSARIRFLGPVPHDDLPVWMNAADVLVLPSYSEGLPVCLMEAAAVGLPMVATDVGGSAEVLRLDPRNTLVSPGSVGQLAVAVGAALAAPRDTRASMLSEAPLFTLDGSVAMIESLYASAAGSPARVPAAAQAASDR